MFSVHDGRRLAVGLVSRLGLFPKSHIKKRKEGKPTTFTWRGGERTSNLTFQNLAAAKPQGSEKPQRQPPGETSKTIKKSLVWIKTGELLVSPVEVITGLTDGSYTEILKGNLSEGQEIVTGTMTKSMAEEMVNPFGRPRFRRR